MNPVSAIKMATINAANCYGLKDKGAVAPGRQADLLAVSYTHLTYAVLENGVFSIMDFEGNIVKSIVL